LDEIDTQFTFKNPDGSPLGIEWFNMLVYTITELTKQSTKIKTQSEEIIFLKKSLQKISEKLDDNNKTD